jgi:hypothetical protein
MDGTAPSVSSIDFYVRLGGRSPDFGIAAVPLVSSFTPLDVLQVSPLKHMGGKPQRRQ